MARAIDLGDAWHPNAHPLEEFKAMVSVFRRISAEHKKTNREICVRIALNCRLGKTSYFDEGGLQRVALCSDRRENERLLEELERLDVTYVVVVPGALPSFAGEIFDDPSDDRWITQNLTAFAEQAFR
jgi:hypothetical protein